jgi:hypothetical protein
MPAPTSEEPDMMTNNAFNEPTTRNAAVRQASRTVAEKRGPVFVVNIAARSKEPAPRKRYMLTRNATIARAIDPYRIKVSRRAR